MRVINLTIRDFEIIEEGLRLKLNEATSPSSIYYNSYVLEISDLMKKVHEEITIERERLSEVNKLKEEAQKKK